MSLSNDEAAGAIERLRGSWPDEQARELLDLPAGELVVVLELVGRLDAVPASPATALRLGFDPTPPAPSWTPPPAVDRDYDAGPSSRRPGSRPPMPADAVKLLRRWGLPLPASYQLDLEHDELDVDPSNDVEKPEAAEHAVDEGLLDLLRDEPAA